MHQPERELPYAAVFAATPASLLVLTPDLVIQEANDAYLTAVGRSREELLGRYVFDVFPEPHDPAGDGTAPLRASMERARDTGRPDTMAVHRYDIPAGGGRFEERYWNPINVPVLDEDGTTVLLLHRAEDVTDFVRARQRGDAAEAVEPALRRRVQEAEADLFARARELEALNADLRRARDELATAILHDSLTGLLIRPAILDHLSRALSRTARRATAVAVLFIDVDDFKTTNDTHGHAVGDELLRCIARRLRDSVRPSDLVARYGGDEFLVLLEDLAGAPDAEAVAARVVAGVRACRPASEPPSVSVGVAVTDRADVSAEVLIARADAAMYRAKQSGGDRYAVLGEPLRQP